MQRLETPAVLELFGTYPAILRSPAAEKDIAEAETGNLAHIEGRGRLLSRGGNCEHQKGQQTGKQYLAHGHS